MRTIYKLKTVLAKHLTQQRRWTVK